MAKKEPSVTEDKKPSVMCPARETCPVEEFQSGNPDAAGQSRVPGLGLETAIKPEPDERLERGGEARREEWGSKRVPNLVDSEERIGSRQAVDNCSVVMGPGVRKLSFEVRLRSSGVHVPCVGPSGCRLNALSSTRIFTVIRLDDCILASFLMVCFERSWSPASNFHNTLLRMPELLVNVNPTNAAFQGPVLSTPQCVPGIVGDYCSVERQLHREASASHACTEAN